MSIYAINQYHKELEKIIHYGGSKKETAIRNAFYNLLNEYAQAKDLLLITEISTKNKQGKTITPDGTLKDSIRNDWGYWESKDEADDINEEIKKKFSNGYPSDNILFEDSHTAVLFQHGTEVAREDMQDEQALHKILTQFLQYERPEVKDFRNAIEKFKEDIPKVTTAIREIIEAQDKTNKELHEAKKRFLDIARASINPDITGDDVKEMMIQHILSADIFNTIFDEPHFHQENNIARELNKIIDTFFTGNVRRQTLGSIKHYYDTINARAASIADHHEKQKFLKVVYENFYKGYNPKAADRLGIVYTPNEIVQFMIRSTDYLLHKHFGKTLGDKNVEILDPATGTGTFITDIIDYLPKNKLAHKYKNELHANEVAILPYYIANLNIEYTYKQKMGDYVEFDNLCFVDTLDNTGFHWVGKQGDLFGVSAENAQRIKRQNERKISVIIGNPPYNAKQENYNYQNANRLYADIDKRIKETYIKQGTAQNQIVVYDMYTRFYRWAMDRLTENGIIAFITNRSFIDARAFDGFRKIIQQDFDHAYIIDTKSDVRTNPKIAGTTHNVFGIQTGVAVLLLVKSTHKQLKPHPCKISYVALDDFMRKEDKWSWFSENDIDKINFENITPDRNNNWVNQSENDWEKLFPLIDKAVKAGKSGKAIFKIYSRGVSTQRDEWVYDFSRDELEKKMKYFVNAYERTRQDNSFLEKGSIKWDRELNNYLKRSISKEFESRKIVRSLYKPYSIQYLYFDRHFNGMTYQWDSIYKVGNRYLCINSGSTDFVALASNEIVQQGALLVGGGSTQCIPLNIDYDNSDNVTDWAVQNFRDHYKIDINKEDIFHYVYAILHHPAYRKKYELNLKQEYPRIPLYENFPQWIAWGKALMDLHINYESTAPYKLQHLIHTYEAKNEAALAALQKPKLKADKEKGIIYIDGFDELHGIPKQAWDYKLGNRSALEWILDQYKEKKPGDPTIAEKFNTYRFKDYKEQVINLLKRVCTVSVETVRIVGEMPG